MDDPQLCLDTNALVAYLKGREPGASAVEKAVRENYCYVTAITVYELLFGVARAKKEIGKQALLDVMTVLPFNEAAARRAANLHAELISQNQDIGIKDILLKLRHKRYVKFCIERYSINKVILRILFDKMTVLSNK